MRFPSSRPGSSSAATRLGQLRFYSFVDLSVLMLGYLGVGARSYAGASSLWFAFLMYLDSRHRDRDRELWPKPVVAGLVILGTVLVASPLVLGFVACAVLYTEKKFVPILGSISPLLNGLVKVSLVLTTGTVGFSTAVLVLCIMSARNLTGDFRDVEKDTADDAKSVPIMLGIRRDVRWMYPVSLAGTTLLWGALGGVSWYWLVLALLVEWFTYGLTPR